MKDLTDKILLWVAVGMTGIMLVATGVNYYLVNKITDNVIQKLSKEYTPGYGPSVDPDKVNPANLNKISQ